MSNIDVIVDNLDSFLELKKQIWIIEHSFKLDVLFTLSTTILPNKQRSALPSPTIFESCLQEFVTKFELMLARVCS